MRKYQHANIWLFALAGLGLIAAILLFPKTYPQAGAEGTKSRNDILRQAEAVLDQVNFSREGLAPTIDFRFNRALLTFVQTNFGVAETNRLMIHEMPVFLWNVRYAEPSRLSAIFSGESEEQRTQKAIEKYVLGEARLQLDVHGRLLLLEINSKAKPDSLAPDLEQAQTLALDLLPFSVLADTGGFMLEKSQVTYEKTRADHEMAWQVPAPVVGLKVQLEAKTQGARLIKWQLKYAPTVAVPAPTHTLAGIGKVLVFLFMIVLVSIFFFKKLRADEMSLKAGLPAAIIAAIGLDLTFITDTAREGLIDLLVPAILMPGFVILGFVIVYGTGESLMRDVGQDRLLTFQAVQRGRWWLRQAGESLWRGAALGLTLFGGVTLILNRLGPMAQIILNHENDVLLYYTASVAPLTVVGENLCYALFAEATYRLLLISILVRYFRQTWAIVAIAALVSALGRTHMLDLSPFGFALGFDFLLGLALALIYLRHDFLTTVTTALTLPLLLHGFSFLYAGKILSPLNGWILLALPVLFIVAGRIIQRHGRTEIDTHALQPDYLKRLAEKERIKKELEIARQVQLSFLPRQLPEVTGLDIAALCIPANEVGGDYYDFVQPGHRRFGVLIGDVSGKGISAAFYMTLTKGIIKSSVQDNLSPVQVLIRANQLFYENAERGIFVSLIYGIFDLESRIFTFARAGHNPILLLRRQEHNAAFVSPNGLALGLEHGEIFRRNIQEQTLVINSGDVFVFYTDGFTEAMNGKNEEFGEPRMLEVLSDCIGASSQETINQIRQAVQSFTGNVPQHDDMTMVVVRVV
ncbi:MAG: PP2C family protein-serine/threonine phosphatase [candidate division KSB1 bacterium]|nr:PP2C family protein-serine/threonine phosphatase [candidate division KSB1 bacterium]MDZ7300530.1 PP2C family protein-serine/threonine phosphatase [candidate division KSB1 bacterium]MDZ7309669.1 PP2C family protein-serine/threonine phosphatase [candidate division KSB1 bacterium]